MKRASAFSQGWGAGASFVTVVTSTARLCLDSTPTAPWVIAAVAALVLVSFSTWHGARNARIADERTP